MLQVDKETWVAREHIKAATYFTERDDECGVEVGDVLVTLGEFPPNGNEHQLALERGFWLWVAREHCEEMAKALGIGPYARTQLITQNPSQPEDQAGT